MNFAAETLQNIQLIAEKGGVMMIPLAICSFIAIIVIIEKSIVLQRKRLVSDEVTRRWQEWFSNGMEKEKLPQNSGAPIVHNIFSTLASLLPLEQTYFEERVRDLSRKERNRLEKGLVFLDVIAGIAPMFGLLGTALGMVDVFAHLSVPGETRMSVLSSGISEALFTTIAGLFIGIPALIAHNLITRHMENLILTAEEQINHIFDHYRKEITG